MVFGLCRLLFYYSYVNGFLPINDYTDDIQARRAGTDCVAYVNLLAALCEPFVTYLFLTTAESVEQFNMYVGVGCLLPYNRSMIDYGVGVANC